MADCIRPQELMSLQDYAARRSALREQVLEAKKARYVPVGENVSLLFENRMTVMYQVLEMLRIERTTDPEGVQAELDAYNPLIPDGTNWKATMLIEFEDAAERQVQLKYLRDVEHHVYAEIDGARIMATADEDMERSNEEKTSSVHFLRFDLPAAAIQALRGGARLVFGIDHARYRYHTEVTDRAILDSLLGDLH